jgi:hypothetical protein
MRFPVLAFAACVLACGGDKQAAAPVPSGPIVGVLELPISLRSKGSAPSDMQTVEISPTAVNAGGQPILTLAPGAAVTAADRQGETLPKLVAALGHHAGMSLAVASAVPYETVALVLSSAINAGVHAVSFQVRAPGASNTQGWLSLDRVQVRAKTKSDEDPAVDGVTKRPWGDFTSKWDDVQGACRASPSGSCAFRPESVAQGGDLKLVLHAAGQGVNVEFFRVGGPAVDDAAAVPAVLDKGKGNKAKGKNKKGGKHKVELLDGVKKPKDVVDEAEHAPPATEALFQFRAQEALTNPSAVSATLKPVCGAAPCLAVMQAEKATLFVRVISLLGAAFPDGENAPSVVFEMP